MISDACRCGASISVSGFADDANWAKLALDNFAWNHYKNSDRRKDNGCRKTTQLRATDRRSSYRRKRRLLK